MTQRTCIYVMTQPALAAAVEQETCKKAEAAAEGATAFPHARVER
jgi:hypothetical protein